MNQASAAQTLSTVPKIWILNHKLNRSETGFSKTTTRTSFIIKTGLIRKNHRILSQSINPMVTTNLNPREKSSKTLTCTRKRSLRTEIKVEVQLILRMSELKTRVIIRTRQQRTLHTWDQIFDCRATCAERWYVHWRFLSERTSKAALQRIAEENQKNVEITTST